jgi:hypothetical protein
MVLERLSLLLSALWRGDDVREGSLAALECLIRDAQSITPAPCLSVVQ